MTKIVSLSSAALMLGGLLLAAPAAEARPGYGQGYGQGGYGRGYGNRGYAYRGNRRRGNVAGAAIAAGALGLAAGAIATQGYRQSQPGYGYYGRPAYGYGY